MNEVDDIIYGASDVPDVANLFPAVLPIRNDVELLREMASFIARNPDVVGGGDMLTITGGRPFARAGLFASVLAGLGLEGGQRAILKYLNVVPPYADSGQANALAWD